MSDLLDAARMASAAGFCVLPAAIDGSKKPYPDGPQWLRWQHELPDDQTIGRWFGPGGRYGGMGVVCGAVSGNLEMLEFEGRAVDERILDAFIDAAEAAGLDDLCERIAAGYQERTPSGGIHWLYRCEKVAGNLKLARRPATDDELAAQPDDRIKVLVETRGEGGFTITAPSNGTTHPTGGYWTQITGGFATVATITGEERSELHALAATFDRMPARQSATHQGSTSDGLRPGDDYNARTTWPALLEPSGWRHIFDHDTIGYWCRPGKETGVSATTNALGTDRLKVFSTSTVFDTDTTYDRFGAYATLEHGGDLSAAAKALQVQGYGYSTTRHGRPEPTAGDSAPGWPVLDPLALHGVVGEFVTAADPYTEADPAAVLITTLVMLGTSINRCPHVLAGNEHHPGATYAAIVGQTSKGGKGTSYAVSRSLIEVADPDFAASQIKGGFGSGEKVVDTVRDPADKDPGATDTRLLIYEPELARNLKVAGRDGSILSMVMRDGWDGKRLEARSRGSEVVASNFLLGVVGHITVEELRARLTDTETYGGFCNRFLWVCARRSKRLPAGGNVPAHVISEYGNRIAPILAVARKLGRLERTPAAEDRWAEIYDDLADDEPGGLLGAVTSRDAPQTLRLSLLFALLDGRKEINVEHVEAAYALWRYCRDSAAFIFGDTLGDPNADKLLVALRRAGPNGLDLTEQSAVFGRHLPARELDRVRSTLVAKHLAVEVVIVTTGRSRTVLVAVEHAKEANKAKEGGVR